MRKLILVFLAMPFAANADIIDLGATTADTAAGLEWLDMSFTDGVTISTVLANANSYVGGGWRFASNAEVDAFVAEITGQSYLGSGYYGAYQGGTDMVAGLVGYTHQNFWYDYLYGFTREDSSDPLFGRYILFDGNTRYQPNADYRNRATSIYNQSTLGTVYGSWLVRDYSAVPEPGTLALFGIGLAGMGLARRRKTS